MKDAPQYNVMAKFGTNVVNFDNYTKGMIDPKKCCIPIVNSLKSKQFALICYINAFSLRK